MPLWRLLLPLGMPLVVLVGGLAWLAISSDSAPGVQPARSIQSRAPIAVPRLKLSPPAAVGPTCHDTPALADALLLQAQRIGVAVRAGSPELPGKDASYRAEHGRLGTITLRQRPMSAEVRCLLISHELIHVLQHWHGELKGVPPLGWSFTTEQLQRFGSVQEAEAYGHQHQAGHVLQLLQSVPATATATATSTSTPSPTNRCQPVQQRFKPKPSKC